MKVTIIQDDGRVGVDGDFRVVDVSELAGEIRAVHFDTVLGVGMIEFDAGVMVEVDVRDFEAERIAYEACGEDRAQLNALQAIFRKVPVRRPPEQIRDFAPYQVYVDRWSAATPPPPPAPSAAQIREAKRATALRALDDQRLAQAAAEGTPLAAVLDYVAAVGGVDQIGVVDALPEL